MERRSFLKGAAVALAAASVPFTLNDPNNRIVELDTEDGWVRVRMNDLRPGDVFRVKNPNGSFELDYGIADGDPFQVKGGIWGIKVKKA